MLSEALESKGLQVCKTLPSRKNVTIPFSRVHFLHEQALTRPLSARRRRSDTSTSWNTLECFVASLWRMLVIASGQLVDQRFQFAEVILIEAARR